jgi:uncharacterized membrane protein
MLKTEPALVISIVAAVLSLLIAFGVRISDEQNTAIINFVTVIAPALITVVSGIIIRANVWSKNSVEKVAGIDIQDAEKILESRKG